jgi:WD40 repeat protein
MPYKVVTMSVEAQAKELLAVRRKVDCERCRKGNTGGPQTIASWLKAKKRMNSRSQNLRKPSTSGVLRRVAPSQPMGRSSQHTTLIEEPQAHTTITPRQSVSGTTSQPSDIAITHRQVISLPSTLKPSTSTVNPGSGTEECGWSISFNNQVGKELNVEMINTLSHEKSIFCVKFSQDGKYLAAGCYDGKAYIYDVSETGTLTWYALVGLLPEFLLIWGAYSVFSKICLPKGT